MYISAKNCYLMWPLTCTRNVWSLKVGSVVATEAGALWTIGLYTVTVGRTGHT